MKAILFVVLCVVGVVFGASPTKPKISDVFRADVSVNIQEGKDFWRGGGLYAFDVPNGEGRTDYRLQNDDKQFRQIHILDRYDLHASYVIEAPKCTKKAVKGLLPSPWAWLNTATFTGTTTFQGRTLDVWQNSDKNFTVKLSVASTDPNVPVFLETIDATVPVPVYSNLFFQEFDTTPPQSWVFSIPPECDNITVSSSSNKLGGDASKVVYFANSNWNCADPNCGSRVPAGSGQAGYACAEFTARSLAYGGYIAGLSGYEPQGSYSNWKGYNLCLTTSLSSALGAIGFHKQANAQSSVHAATAIFGDAGDGSFSHSCIGVGDGIVDCHNNARLQLTASGIMYQGIDAVWGAP